MKILYLKNQNKRKEKLKENKLTDITTFIHTYMTTITLHTESI